MGISVGTSTPCLWSFRWLQEWPRHLCFPLTRATSPLFPRQQFVCVSYRLALAVAELSKIFQKAVTQALATLYLSNNDPIGSIKKHWLAFGLVVEAL